MWTTTTIIGWLEGLGVTVPLKPGTGDTREWDLLDRVGIVTPTAGPGLFLEGAADTSGFQLRIRGAQNNPHDAETTALDADRRILTARTPVLVGSTRLLSVTRAGGRPTSLPSPDTAGRTEFTCTYLTRILEVPS